MGHLRTGPGTRGSIPWSKRRTRRRVLADKANASKVNRDVLRGCHRDGIMRTAARHPPGIDPCGVQENAGQADLQTPLEGLSNAYATMQHRPTVRAGQNKTPSWCWWRSGRICGEPLSSNTSNSWLMNGARSLSCSMPMQPNGPAPGRNTYRQSTWR